MNIHNIKPTIIKSIILLIFILYLCFLYIDYNNIQTTLNTDKLKYISILLCFLLALFTGNASVNTADSLLLQLGLFFTTLADLCLLILNNLVCGVAIFCLVQIIYCIRYAPNKTYSTVINFIITSEIIVILYITTSLFIRRIDILYVFSIIYFVCLITSVVRAIKLCKGQLLPIPNKYMVAAGMVLFLLCDINVGLATVINLLSSQSIFLGNLHHISTFLIWFFYLPSQLLLALSSYKLSVIFKNN